MKSSLLAIVFLFFLNFIFVQAGMGILVPDASSVLDISASYKSILIPQAPFTDLNGKEIISDIYKSNLMNQVEYLSEENKLLKAELQEQNGN